MQKPIYPTNVHCLGTSLSHTQKDETEHPQPGKKITYYFDSYFFHIPIEPER